MNTNNTKSRDGKFDFSGTEKEEVGLLAVMCALFRPWVVKGRLFKKTYAYYILNDDRDIDFARYLFSKNNVQTEKHESRIMGRDNKKIVLRMKYTNFFGQNTDFIEDVYARFSAFGLKGMDAEWKRLSDVLEREREKYNELEK
ncbi:MAG: hypothetical protein J6W27_02460 [Alphaproteobacteria bacterium]|nr:hypothetical protein [Alphaproteobacteria bacterium]